MILRLRLNVLVSVVFAELVVVVVVVRGADRSGASSELRSSTFSPARRPT